jgi:hypothetical protein
MRPEARYANTFEVWFDAFEFVIECGQSEPGRPGETAPHTRIITTPAFARELGRILRRSVDEYETRFGPLPVQSEEEPK